MGKTMMVTVTCGPEDAERATIGMGMAYNAIQNPDVDSVVVGLQSNGIWLAKDGIAPHIETEGMPPFEQIMQGFLASGGHIVVCEPCANARKLTQETCAEGTTIVAAQDMVKEMVAADSTVVY